MGLTMNEILKKHADCDCFSLTGEIQGYNITEEEYEIALNKMPEEHKKIIAQSKKECCNKNEKSPLEQIPEELKKHFLFYEISFFNSVTISGALMINYYFKLNDETKKYLLKFRNDFNLGELEDLTLYKNDKTKFYSCTHEGFNSIEFDYKKMSPEEIINYLNDELYEDKNDMIFETIYTLIQMKKGTKFSFKDLDITDINLMQKICDICGNLKLELFAVKNKKHNWKKINNEGEFELIDYLPAVLCSINDLIEKKR